MSSAPDRGRIAAAQTYDERAAEANGHAHVLREMLVKLPALPALPAWDRSGLKPDPQRM